MARRSMSPRSSDSESEGGRPGSEIFDDLSGKKASSINYSNAPDFVTPFLRELSR